MKRYFVAIMLMAAAAVSCETEIKFNGEYSGEKLVVQCIASESDGIYAKVSSSQFVLKKYTEALGTPIKDADVSIRTAGGEKPMYWNEELGMYLCDYIPAVGETLELEVYSTAVPENNRRVTASTSVVGAPDFDIVGCMIVNNDEILSYSDCFLKVRIRMKGLTGKDFYQLFVMDTEHYSSMASYSNDPLFLKNLNAFEAVIDGGGKYEAAEYFTDALCEDSEYTFDIYVVLNSGTTELTNNVSVIMTRLSSDFYQYIQTVEAYNDFDATSLFGEAVCIHNNIKGGIGCFGSYSSTAKELK